MNLGIYFSFFFALNLMICFFLIWPSLQEEESPKNSSSKIFFCFGLFILLCAVFSQLGYLLSFIFPVLYSSKILAFAIPVGIILSFFTLSKNLFSLSFVQYKAVSCFVIFNGLALFQPFSAAASMRSPMFVLLIVTLPALTWVSALILSSVLLDKFKLEIPEFSVFNFPAFIISIGLILLMLTPLWL